MTRKKHFNPKKAIHNRTADSLRVKKREEARLLFDRQMAKEREIGIDPIFRHGPYRSDGALRSAWLKESREWDKRWV